MAVHLLPVLPPQVPPDCRDSPLYAQLQAEMDALPGLTVIPPRLHQHEQPHIPPGESQLCTEQHPAVS
jgi:hypothetical protein